MRYRHRVPHPELNEKESRNLVKMIVNEDKKTGQKRTIGLVRDGEVVSKISRKTERERGIVYYDIETGKEISYHENYR